MCIGLSVLCIEVCTHMTCVCVCACQCLIEWREKNRLACGQTDSERRQGRLHRERERGLIWREREKNRLACGQTDSERRQGRLHRDRERINMEREKQTGIWTNRQWKKTRETAERERERGRIHTLLFRMPMHEFQGVLHVCKIKALPQYSKF